ncbi:MAG: hypothetical protein JWL58_887 [Streptosporangiaceae bacterium]|nr:hypothetical protein [Streptosporangiaceae bacterium]
MTELLPTKTTYRAGDRVHVEVRGLEGPAVLTVWRLGERRHEVAVTGPGLADLGPLPVGGYGVELGGSTARTAVEVTADPRSVLRYGFVASYLPDRDVTSVAENLRRLHLTGVQFYDWAYRHADLLGGGETYTDALGQPVSLATVRRLIDACHSIGAQALGYAAVYAVGPDEWAEWEHDALLTPTGQPYGLGDFLFIVDPAAPDWTGHFTADLAAAVKEAEFDGFHLDQYGYPKRAYRPDGQAVDVTASFSTLIGAARDALPDARLVFNNVNDFPTWASAHTPQDAVYIEVWPPHVTLGDLAVVATRARAEAGDKPVVIAAYQHVYDTAPSATADLAASLTMATLYSHGATQLLCGEAGNVLVDPYYVRNHPVTATTADLLRRWYDFLVEHGELLTVPGITDVTSSYAGDYNDDLDVGYAGTDVGHTPVAGTVWRRITQVGDQLVIHLINLTGQTDTHWDAPRDPPGDPGPGTLRVRRTGPGLPRIRIADPDRQARLIDVPVTADGDHAIAQLPPPHLWMTVLISQESYDA